mgnify:FL=1
MQLPTWFNLMDLASMGAIVMLIVQYIKGPIPEKYLRYVTLLVGILVSLFSAYLSGKAIDYIQVIGFGILAAVIADGGYAFLSGGKSPAFTLPSQTQLNGGAK